MDPFSLTLISLVTQLLRVIEQGQIAFNSAPAEYRQHFYERLLKYEDRADRLMEPAWGLIEKALAAAEQAKK